MSPTMEQLIAKSIIHSEDPVRKNRVSMVNGDIDTLLRLSLEIADIAEKHVQTIEEMKKIMDFRVVAKRVEALLEEEK